MMKENVIEEIRKWVLYLFRANAVIYKRMSVEVFSI